MPAQPVSFAALLPLLLAAAPAARAHDTRRAERRAHLPHVIPVAQGPGFVERRNAVNAKTGKPPYKPSVSSTTVNGLRVVVLEDAAHDEHLPPYAVLARPEDRSAALAELRQALPESTDFASEDSGALVTLEEHLRTERRSARLSHGIIRFDAAKSRAAFEKDLSGGIAVLYLYIKP